jgi:hypothetical protein
MAAVVDAITPKQAARERALKKVLTFTALNAVMM